MKPIDVDEFFEKLDVVLDDEKRSEEFKQGVRYSITVALNLPPCFANVEERMKEAYKDGYIAGAAALMLEE